MSMSQMLEVSCYNLMQHATSSDLLNSLKSFVCVAEICRAPVIAAIHGGCIGAGIDMITACDIRLCSEDAWFSVKEVDIGMAADVGKLIVAPTLRHFACSTVYGCRRVL